MPKIYIYKLTVDDGGAPCVRDDMLSLAICKPTIRSVTQRGSVVLGFAGNSLYSDNSLVYVARVTKNLDGREYFSESRYASRPDCIYRWDGRRFQWKTGSKFHSKSAMAHDMGRAPTYSRAMVLLSKGADNFRYFKEACPIRYKNEYPRLKSLVEALGQGHRVNFEPELRVELRRFIEILLNTPSAYQETPIPDSPCPDRCGTGDDDIVCCEG